MLLTETQRLPGLDGRKMSKSYGNSVLLSDSPETIDKKLSRMVTDTARARRTDPGEPGEVSGLQPPQDLLAPRKRSGSVRRMPQRRHRLPGLQEGDDSPRVDDLAPFREKKAYYDKRPDDIRDVIAEGNRVAGEEAAATMSEVRSALTL